ncbi:cubilin-like isoform X1 [Mercenaria mercenaria]|uniref:cubilin-like isoform X1 n=1 Tax=Mercenaria mercenaria TaxID=6596 RepID=UPI00234F7984|nr:cubilin-like isoform X1 [Mercenaria mercenaria]
MAQYFNINMYKVLLLMILLLIGNKTVEGCAEGWELNNGKCYLFSMKYYGWEDAKIYCEYLGANLVKIDDDEEHKYIKSRISAMELHYAWIGAKYSRVRRKYLWIDGSEITFSGWAPGEPGGRRGCVDYLYKYDYLWHSHCDCKYTRGPFICEKAPKGHDESIVDKEDAAATRTDGPEPTLKPTDSTVNLDDVFKGSDFCGKETTVTADSSTQTEESRLTPSYVQKSTADGIFIPGANVDITDRPDVNISTLDRKVLDTTISTEKTDEDIKIGRVVSEPVCGGVLTSRQGILESPGFPNYYTNNLRCSYTINMDLQDVILLRFDPDNFDIEFASNCVYDRVAVYAGYNSNSLLLGKYCGTTAPQPISSLGQMHIQFWTDGSVVRTGYIAHYTVTECGGVFTEPYGIIETPNGHTDYHNNQNCTWIITVVPNRVIQLKFQMFDLEEHSTCNYDYLDIYDGRSLASPLIGRYCGDAIPSEQIRSTSNTMTINFITDSSVTRAGFRAAYNTTYVCGGVLTSRQGILESPGFPNYYTNDLRCNYTINMDLQHVILLRFDPDNFDIEIASNCVYDWVAVYAGNNSNSLLLGKYCGTTAPQPISSLGQIHIQFWTDYSVVRSGYRAYYTIKECGGVFTEPYGIIETPNEPTDYHNNQNCTWSITVVPNRVIQLKFQMFDLQAHSTCNYDYLDIYDGPSLASPLIGRYCGDAIPSEQIRSTSNTMTINFITDSSVTRAGFRAAYNTTYDKPNKPSYVCYPNNTIIVHDLPANSYYLAVQKIPSSTDIRCTVSRLNTTTIEITGCLKDDPIVFTYGSYAGIESYKIHVGQSVNINITCHEISEDGVSVVINNTFAVNLQVDSENMVDPSYNVTSSLNTTSTNVNEPVAWTITFPVEYIVEVTSCTAEPDTTDNTDLVVQLISEGGCTVDRELISNFEDNLDGTAVATLWSFKFNNYDTILLKCDVIICPGASNACYTICSRQKRDIPDRSYRQADDSFSTVVQSRLHVIDHKSSGTMPAPQTVAVMMFQLVAVLLIK